MSSPIISVAQGKLKGEIGTDYSGNSFLKFLGIPYAKPPIGDLRFKAPVEPEPWNGVRDATKEGDNCISKNAFTDQIEGSEDCLTLNVFTKETKDQKSLKPVMVFIHGGAFTMGSSQTSFYGPEFLMTEDIVLVTINYRLGMLGFLSLEDTSLGVPGNAGLKDQALALKWVQKNIKSFNGDPNNVTIFGESAGAASVHFQILSPTTKGLFHKAILQSGCVLNPWPWGSRNAIEIAKTLGKDAKTEKEALGILKTTPALKLLEAQEKFEDNICLGVHRPFGPVIEKPNETAFLTKDPIDVLATGEYNQVPMIMGYTSREGMLVELTSLKTKEFDIKNIDLEKVIPWQLGIKSGSDTAQKVVQKLQQLYLQDTNEKDNIYQLFTDSLFLAGIMATMKHHLNTGKNPIFFYKMSVESELNALKNVIVKVDAPGVCHGDDLSYLFKAEYAPKIKPGSAEEKYMKRFVKLWTSFATHGNPTPSDEFNVTWTPVSDKENIVFLDIGEELMLHVNPEAKRMSIWKEVFQLSPSTTNYL